MNHSHWLHGVLGSCLLTTSAFASLGPTPDVSTVRFDLTTAPLGFFGLEFSADYATPVEDVLNRQIVSTRVHLEFNTENDFGSLPDAADIAVQFQPPTVNLPIVTFAGADFGWTGTGSFIGDLETDLLNEPILDFSGSGPGDLALWFTRIVSLDDENPVLGGAFVDSYIEVDLAVLPEPTSLLLITCSAGALLLRRRR